MAGGENRKASRAIPWLGALALRMGCKPNVRILDTFEGQGYLRQGSADDVELEPEGVRVQCGRQD